MTVANNQLTFNTGLPTQDEINRWDDHQRAAGHQMVRVLPSKEAIQRRLEAAGYRKTGTVWIPASDDEAYPDPGYYEAWALSPSGKYFHGWGDSETEALTDLAGELGVRV